MEDKNTNQLLGMKDIGKYNKERLGENINRYLTSTWGFDKTYEKLIITGILAWGVYAFFKIFFGSAC